MTNYFSLSNVEVFLMSFSAVGRSSNNVVGVMCHPLIEIGLNYLQKYGGGLPHLALAGSDGPEFVLHLP